MFVLIFLIFIWLCVLTVFVISKILEIEKDIDTLYDNYSLQIENMTKNNINNIKERGSLKC